MFSSRISCTFLLHILNFRSFWNPPVFLGKVWKLAQRSKSMIESVKRKCWRQLRYLILSLTICSKFEQNIAPIVHNNNMPIFWTGPL
jgi:hypothetical protein